MSVKSNTINEEVMQDVINAVESIKFGQVQITIHDSKVVQIDKTEKIRFDNQPIKK